MIIALLAHINTCIPFSLSVGISGRALGMNVVVHMSRDAKSWKKDLLKNHGAEVVEHDGDYGVAVTLGRKTALETPNTHFVDDENSVDLLLGYSVAAFELKQQLLEADVTVDEDHPLVVHIPCGVGECFHGTPMTSNPVPGGAGGGICFGLKMVFQDLVEIVFAEPTSACSMLLGLASGKFENTSVTDVGLQMDTVADGLACASPSSVACRAIERLLFGIYTVTDDVMLKFVATLHEMEGSFAEPSSVAVFGGIARMSSHIQSCQEGDAAAVSYLLEKGTHVFWLTGGLFVPEKEREELIRKGRMLSKHKLTE